MRYCVASSPSMILPCLRQHSIMLGWPTRMSLQRSAQSAMNYDRVIVSYEAALAAAKRDFVNVNATLALFEQATVTSYPSNLSIARMFKRGEIFELCQIALSGAPQGQL